MAAYAIQLKDAVDLDAVCADMARAVRTALEPAHVSVWTSRRDLMFISTTYATPAIS